MKKAYYLFNPGRMSRKDQTLCFAPTVEQKAPAKKRYLPINGISALYVFGSVDANSAMYNYLGKQHIPVHFFDYYHHYTGSFSPREHLLAGQVIVAQSKTYLSKKKRMLVAQEFVRAAVANMLRTLKYYQKRDKNVGGIIEDIEALATQIGETTTIQKLMGVEGACRQAYYQSFDEIVEGYAWEGRRKRPPKNELNALVSFGNSMCYTACLDAIYNSQLNPTISFLHEPGYRRYSLALDVAEIFKPILVDRLIFKLCNKKMLRAEHFDFIDNACFLSDTGRKIFVQAWEEKLQETFTHRKLNKKVSYRYLIRIECYSLCKYLLGMQEKYVAFRGMW